MNEKKWRADFDSGNFDPDNPSSIPEKTLNSWVTEGWVHYLATGKICWRFMQTQQSSVYRLIEKLPKALLEAASVGRPLVSFDVPGCREIVRNGENGVLQNKSTLKV